MTVAAIPKEDQVPILETTIMDVLAQCYGIYGSKGSEVMNELHRRLQAGAAKYGTAWCEVNLTEDLREELLDAMNYIGMLAVRRESNSPRGTADDVLLGMVAELVFSAYKIVSEIEGCEGPTSKDWVGERGDTEAQARFQEVLHATE